MIAHPLKNHLSRFTIFLTRTNDEIYVLLPLESRRAPYFSMQRKTRQTLAKRQGYCVSAKLTLEEYIRLQELVTALGTNRSAWIRQLIRAGIAVPKNNNKAA